MAVGDIGDLMMAMCCGLVAAIVSLYLMYKMIDGDLPVVPGLVCISAVGGVLYFAIHPPHPVVPIVCLVVALTLLALYPFAASQLEEKDLRLIVSAKLERASEAVQQKPDNVAAWFQVAVHLYELGYDAQALAVGSKALDTISTRVDDVQNRSMKDIFHQEFRTLQRWKSEVAKNGLKSGRIECPDCKRLNPPDQLFCENCGKPYLVNRARNAEAKPKFIVKLAVSWAMLAIFLVGITAIGLTLPAPLMIGSFVASLIGIGVFFSWLFRKPKLA